MYIKGIGLQRKFDQNLKKKFEKYCESNNHIEWFYKNGDKGNEYFSIVYEDNAGKQKSFYPDYIVHDTEGNTWIIETKGGIVRQDKQSSELCICTEEYSNDIKDDNWKLLKEIL